MIDFSQVIKKLKFDKIMGRKANEKTGTSYLECIQEKAQKLNYMDDLLLSECLNCAVEVNPNIMD